MTEAKHPDRRVPPAAPGAEGAEGWKPAPLDPNKKGPQDESTTFFTLPQFRAEALQPATEGKLLEALKAQISKLKVELEGSGIRHVEGAYATLPRTLRSAWMVKVDHPVVGELRFLVGQTRSIWVLLYDTPHERLYEDPRFMGVELKQRDVTLTPKGKRMYVSRIERADLDKLNAIAAQDARGRGAPDSLVPTEGSFSLEETLERLRQCALVECTDPGFALNAFLDRIHFMTPTQGRAGNYYHLDVTTPEGTEICELHLGADDTAPAAGFRHKALLRYREEPCTLYLGVNHD